MSPRAASRLAALGFEQVYDYENGKADWFAYGLPRAGTSTERYAGDAVRRDVPTCTLADDLDAVRARVRERGFDTCLVVDANGVVIGRLGRAALRESGGTVEEAMSEGPVTVRPSTTLERARARMDKNELTSLPVTTPDGRLAGLLLRDDL